MAKDSRDDLKEQSQSRICLGLLVSRPGQLYCLWAQYLN